MCEREYEKKQAGNDLSKSVVIIYKVTQRLQLRLGHVNGSYGVTVEDKAVVGKVDSSDVGYMDNVTAPHAEERRRLSCRGIPLTDGLIEDGQRGEMGAHLSVCQLKVGVVAVSLEIYHLVEIDNLYAVT